MPTITTTIISSISVMPRISRAAGIVRPPFRRVVILASPSSQLTPRAAGAIEDAPLGQCLDVAGGSARELEFVLAGANGRREPNAALSRRTAGYVVDDLLAVRARDDDAILVVDLAVLGDVERRKLESRARDRFELHQPARAAELARVRRRNQRREDDPPAAQDRRRDDPL